MPRSYTRIVSHGSIILHVSILFGHIHPPPQKTREGWVSSANEGEGNASCGCDSTAKAASGSLETASDGIYHWDGAEPDKPRGRCMGDSHGPQCGHDVRACHTRLLDCGVG